jgi:hypothetical protein
MHEYLLNTWLRMKVDMAVLFCLLGALDYTPPSKLGGCFVCFTKGLKPLCPPIVHVRDAAPECGHPEISCRIYPNVSAHVPSPQRCLPNLLWIAGRVEHTYGLCRRLVQCIANHPHKPYASDGVFEATCNHTVISVRAWKDDTLSQSVLRRV